MLKHGPLLFLLSDTVAFEQLDPDQQVKFLVCLQEPSASAIGTRNKDTLSAEDMVDDED